MTVRIDTAGFPELQAALREMGDDVRQEVSKIVQATGLALRADIVKRYQRGPATGRIYTRGGITRQASAPGEAPMSDTGRLAAGTLYSTVSPLSVTVYNSVQYAEWLEFGTRNIAERPAWTPAANQARKKFLAQIRAAVMRGAK